MTERPLPTFMKQERDWRDMKVRHMIDRREFQRALDKILEQHGEALEQLADM